MCPSLFYQPTQLFFLFIRTYHILHNRSFFYSISLPPERAPESIEKWVVGRVCAEVPFRDKDSSTPCEAWLVWSDSDCPLSRCLQLRVKLMNTELLKVRIQYVRLFECTSLSVCFFTCLCVHVCMCAFLCMSDRTRFDLSRLY